MEIKANTYGQFEKIALNKLLGLRLDHASNGVAKLSLPERQELNNNFDVVHGGVLMTMFDSAMSNAARSKIDFAMSVVTININTSFLRPGKGPLVAHARAIGGGSSVCFCESEILDENNEVVAKAIGSFKYMKPKP